MIVGKTNTPEFGMVPTCEPVLFGPTRNPWDTTRSTSGSSGGSAAAVASGMVAAAHANDLGGSIRFPASACGLFGLKPTRARNPLGPEYGDVISGWAVEHALTRSVRDSAALLDATSGPARGDPYLAPPPVRPFAAEVGVDPGRLRIAYTPRTPGGSLGHPDCLAALDDAVRLCASLGHELVEADLPGLDADVGSAIGKVFNAATAWIVRYWIRRIGREPRADEIEPITRAYWQSGERVSAAEYLQAIEDLQRFSRRVAEFLTTVRHVVDADHVDSAGAARRDRLERRRTAARRRTRRPDRGLSSRRRQHHRQSSHVGSAVVERQRLTDRRAFPRPLRRRSDAHSSGLATGADSALESPYSTRHRTGRCDSESLASQ